MFLKFPCDSVRASLGGLVVKNPLANAGATGDADSTPRSERSPGGGNGNPLQYSFLFFTPIFLPGKSRGQRSLAGYSP